MKSAECRDGCLVLRCEVGEELGFRWVAPRDIAAEVGWRVGDISFITQFRNKGDTPTERTQAFRDADLTKDFRQAICRLRHDAYLERFDLSRIVWI